jgi:glycosyltransferase involved in cell wall biosynthesis
LLHFRQVPAVYVCHGFRASEESPFYFPRILRYVAVDGRCKKRIESAREIPQARIEVIPNAVDLDRFQPRLPLPSRPKRALVFSNYASPRPHLPAIRSACRDLRLELDVLGVGVGAAVGNPESHLPRYDVVFAKARCALEAIAVGVAVVVCDFLAPVQW